MGHLRLTIGYLKATVVHIRVTLGHLKVTIGNFFSELHPKVRPTCFLLQLLCVMISHLLTVLKHKMPSQILNKNSWIGLVNVMHL